MRGISPHAVAEAKWPTVVLGKKANSCFANVSKNFNVGVDLLLKVCRLKFNLYINCKSNVSKQFI